MIARVSADILVIVHALFVLYVVVGGLLVLKWRWTAWMHLPCAIWGVLIELAGWICPLTPLENALRRAAGEAGYGEGFVAHYLLPLVYPGELTRGVQILLGVAVLLINAIIYAIVLFRLRRGS